VRRKRPLRNRYIRTVSEVAVKRNDMSTPVGRRSTLAACVVAAVSLLVGVLPASAADPDTVAPVTTHSFSSVPDSPNGQYFTGPVELTLSASDASGIEKTEYRIDGGPWATYGGPAPEKVIFDGTQASLDKWRQSGPGQFRLLPDGSIVSTGGMGMLWYPEEYGDVAIKLEWKEARPDPGFSNSGVFVRSPDPAATAARAPEDRYPCQVGSGQTDPVWVAVYCGQEIQIYDGPSGEAQKTGSVYNFKSLDLAGAHPNTKGEWNEYEIRTVGGGDYTVTVIRNGEVINKFVNTPGLQSSRGGDPSTGERQFASGFIGLQNHSYADWIQFRNIRVQSLAPTAPLRIADAGRHTVEYRSTDTAGNVEAVRSVAVNIDEVAPSTTARLSPADPGPGGTYDGPVTVALDATDDAAVERTEYRVDGGGWQAYENPTEVIFDGTEESFSKWRQAPSGGFFLQEDGSIRSVGGLGMFWYPVKEYGDVAIKLQFRDAREDGGASNSGVFVRFPYPEGRESVCDPQARPAWNAIYCGQEVQIYDGATGEVQKTGSIYNFKPTNLEQARPTPAGEWNDYEIRTVGAGDYEITVIRNGVVINEYKNTPDRFSSRQTDPPTLLRQYASGYIGLQNHGSSDAIEFRNVRVEDLSPDAAAFEVSGPGDHIVEFRSVDEAGRVEETKAVHFTIGGAAAERRGSFLVGIPAL
jgi:hypothetical protein